MTESEQQPKPLLVVQPARKIAGMTPEERRAFAEQLARATVEAAKLAKGNR